MGDAFFEEGSRLLTPSAFEFVLDGELKRAVRSQNFLTLLVIPTIYEILDEARAKVASWFGVKPKQMTAEHPAPGMVGVAAIVAAVVDAAGPVR